MARVRMMVVALAACSRAEAVPPPAIQPPAGWQPLAELATAASEAAKGDGVPVEAAAAWGDTAMGCYALALTVRGDSSPAAISKELAAGFVATKIGDVAAGSDSVALTFERGAYRGKLHAQIRDSAIEAVACFWNEREPDACAAACAGMMK